MSGLSFDLPDNTPLRISEYLSSVASSPDTSSHLEQLLAIARLPAFSKLWREMSRKKPDGTFVYLVNRDGLFEETKTVWLEKFAREFHADSPAINLGMGIAREWFVNLQGDFHHDEALLVIFKYAIQTKDQAGKGILKLFRSSKIKDAKEEMARRAAFFLEEAESADDAGNEDFLSKGGGTLVYDPLVQNVDWRSVSKSLRQLAAFYTGLAERSEAELQVTRNSRSSEIGLAAALKMGRLFVTLFGNGFYGLTAELASELTGERVTDHQVKDLLAKNLG